MPVDRAVCVGWFGVVFAGAVLGVDREAGAGVDAAATAGLGAGGLEATGTALWQAAIDRIPARLTAVRICCLIIF